MLSQVADECPRYLLEQGRRLPAVRTAVVNAGSMVAMESARQATAEGLMEPVLVGDQDAIRHCSMELDWDISNFQCVSAADETKAANLAALMAGAGEVAVLMKGDVHSGTILKAVLKEEHGLRTDARLSHVFHMTVPGSDQSLCITDAVINVAPSVGTRTEIARNAVSLMHALGNQNPRVAVLSAIESPTPAMPSSIEAAEIVEKCRAIPNADFQGPLAFDLAVSPRAVQAKGFDGEVAGRADALLVPTIEVGNALFKMMVHFMSAAAAGIVLGARVPVTLTSRSDSVASRLAASALSAIYANAQLTEAGT